MTFRKIALIDRTSSAPQGASAVHLQPDDMVAMVKAIFGQLKEFSAAWGITAPESMSIAPSTAVLDAETVEIGIWQNPDDPGAAGYHTVDPRGKPYGKVFLAVCDGIRTAKTMSLSGVLSHEALELWGNRYVNSYVLRVDGSTLDSREACDAVEDVVYDDPEGTGCQLSDYLLPSAFSEGDPAPYDRQGVLANKYDTTPGGYRSTLTAEATETGEMKVRCVVYYGPKHPMAESAALAVTALRQKVKRKSVELRHRVSGSIEWRALMPSPQVVAASRAAKAVKQQADLLAGRAAFAKAQGVLADEAREKAARDMSELQAAAATASALALAAPQGDPEDRLPTVRAQLVQGRVPANRRPNVATLTPAQARAMVNRHGPKANVNRAPVTRGFAPQNGTVNAPPPHRPPVIVRHPQTVEGAPGAQPIVAPPIHRPGLAPRPQPPQAQAAVAPAPAPAPALQLVKPQAPQVVGGVRVVRNLVAEEFYAKKAAEEAAAKVAAEAAASELAPAPAPVSPEGAT